MCLPWCDRYGQESPVQGEQQQQQQQRGHTRRHSSADTHKEEGGEDGEELTDQTATLTLTSATARARAQSDSQHDRRINSETMGQLWEESHSVPDCVPMLDLCILSFVVDIPEANFNMMTS